MAITLTDLAWRAPDGVYSSRLDQNLDGGSFDRLTIGFYDYDYDNEPVPHQGSYPGTYDLAAEPSYFDCGHCVVGRVNEDVDGDAQKLFFQASGTLTLDEVGLDVFDGTGNFSLSDVILVEAEIDFSDGTTTVVPNGECLFLEGASFVGFDG